MGLRVRLKASFDVSGFPRQARIVLVALKRYGMIVADNGSDWYISGAPNPGWSNDQLRTLGRVKGSDLRGGRHLEASALAASRSGRGPSRA